MKTLKIFLALSILVLLALPAKAQLKETTPSATIKEKLKERLEKTATASAENNEASPAASPKYYAWVGTLSGIENKTILVETDEGKKEAIISEQATILQTEKGKSRKEVKLENLKINNFIIAIGLREGEKIKATRVISSPPEAAIEKKVVFGKVVEVEEEKIKLSQQNNQEEISLPLSSKTLIKINKNGKEGKIKDIQLEDRLFAVVIQKNNKISETTTIFVLAGKNNPQVTLQSPEVIPSEATAAANP